MQEKQNAKNATSSTGNLRLDDFGPSHPNSTISSTTEFASHYHDPDDGLVAYGSNPLSYFEVEPSPLSPSPLSFVANSFDITTEYIEELAAKKSHQEADIEEATNQLLNQTIPKFAEQLQRMLASFPPTQQSIFAYEWLVVWLHWNGINIRHLGTLRANIPKENNTLRGLLLNIMISRVLKNMSNHRLRMEMRRLKYAGDYPYQQTLVSFLNTVFGTSTESLTFWNTHLKHALLYQFPDALTPQETNLDLRVLALDSPIINKDSKSLHSRHSYTPPSTTSSKEYSPETSLPSPSKRSVDAQAATESLPFKVASAAFIRDLIKEGGDFDLPIEPICFLFFSFCRLVGLNLKASHMKSFASNPALFDVAEPLNVLDLSGAPQKVKTLQIVSHAEGLVWKVRAEAASAMPKSQQFAVGLWKLSLESYKQSLLANPRDQRTIRNVAEVYHALGMQELAGAFAHLAIETNPDDPVSLYKYATFIYSTTKNMETSKRYFEAAIRATPTTPGAILAYAEFCLKLGRIPQAASLVERCVADFPNSWDGLHKLAYLNHTVLKDYDKAHEYYKKAIEIECKDLVLLAHYVAFLKDIIKDESLAASYELFMKKLEQKTTIAGRGSKLWDMAMK
jgi:Tfp pilus assembly protein PilF